MNQGWGMSDGEGLERIWWFLAPLIAALRYATSENRLEMLNMRALHHNDLAKDAAGMNFSLSPPLCAIHGPNTTKPQQFVLYKED